ncbi:MAG: phospho-N-acetylmuramoyl-pentapeptide-transferase [Eubacterium sp.]|nr:phospho-N-acetylmuramoyl-pentapeptide-transferase [Eubacterium sp.]
MTRYLMIEALIPMLVAFVISTVITKKLIPFLIKKKIGQYEREEEYEAHLKKAGTPTMGGVGFISAVILVSVFYIPKFPNIVPILIATAGFAIIGCIDDSKKLFKKQSEGMKPLEKTVGQIVIAVGVIAYLKLVMGYDTKIKVPFIDGEYNLGIFYYILVFIMILGTVNGSNLNDGIDGLAGSVTSVIAVFLTVASFIYKAGISPVTAAWLGGLLGFLLFNAHPAKIFMGDTGALALGGFVASSALVLKQPLIVILIAFAYLVETVSVMMQVTYFKLTHGKRIFKMTPIHLSFEIDGWSETRIVMLFTVVTVITCFIALAAL